MVCGEGPVESVDAVVDISPRGRRVAVRWCDNEVTDVRDIDAIE